MKRKIFMVATSIVTILCIAVPAYAQGNYRLTHRVTGNPALNNYADAKGWKVFWQVPKITGGGRLVVGDWFMDIEMGFSPDVYHPDDWYPYLFSGGSDNTRTTACNTPHPSGVDTFLIGTCYGFAPVHPGQLIKFRGEVINGRTTMYVDIPSDSSNWLLMGDRNYNLTEARNDNLAMYGHEVETFESEHPAISCTNFPLKMLEQDVMYFSKTGWFTLGGAQWTRTDSEPTTDNWYKFTNVATGVTPSHWDVCSV